MAQSVSPGLTVYSSGALGASSLDRDAGLRRLLGGGALLRA